MLCRQGLRGGGRPAPRGVAEDHVLIGRAAWHTLQNTASGRMRLLWMIGLENWLRAIGRRAAPATRCRCRSSDRQRESAECQRKRIVADTANINREPRPIADFLAQLPQGISEQEEGGRSTLTGHGSASPRVDVGTMLLICELRWPSDEISDPEPVRVRPFRFAQAQCPNHRE